MTQTRAEKIQAAFVMRQDEVENYQINIDSYERAIANIDAKPQTEKDALASFRNELVQRLEAERRERDKAQVMLDVLQEQIP